MLGLDAASLLRVWLGHIILVSYILGVQVLTENRRLTHTVRGILDELLLIQHVNCISMFGVGRLVGGLGRLGYCVFLGRDCC